MISKEILPVIFVDQSTNQTKLKKFGYKKYIISKKFITAFQISFIYLTYKLLFFLDFLFFTTIIIYLMNFNYTEEQILDHFNTFLKIDRSKKIPSSKKVKLKFLEEQIIRNRLLLTKRGYQLCTTRLSKEYDVTQQTIMNWITNLMALRILKCTNRHYKKGLKSRTYIIEPQSSHKDIINIFNGYNNKYAENLERMRQKEEYRSKAWEKLDPLTYEFKDVLRVAQCYLGCEEQFFKEVHKRVPTCVLNSPRENNILESKLMDFYYAFKIVTKNNNFGKVTPVSLILNAGGSLHHHNYAEKCDIRKDSIISYMKRLKMRFSSVKLSEKMRISQIKGTLKFAYNFKPYKNDTRGIVTLASSTV